MGTVPVKNRREFLTVGPRRVIRHGANFICGLCRAVHADERDALSCLDRCWHEVSIVRSVVKARRALKTRFLCRFCARDHQDAASAEACARDCLQQRQTKYAREAELTEMVPTDLPPPPQRGGRQNRPQLVVVYSAPRWRSHAKVAGKPVQTVEAVPESADFANSNVVAQTAAANPDVTIASHQPAEQVVATGKTESQLEVRDDKNETSPALASDASAVRDDDKFQRVGAQYVCKKCSKKLFTRAEVIQCYDSH